MFKVDRIRVRWGRSTLVLRIDCLIIGCLSSFSACTGDSGSGLFQQTIENDRWCLLGVTSSSNTHICEQTQFTTYVHAASLDYEPWLRDVLDRKKSLEDLQRLQRCKSRTWGQEFCRWYAC